MGRCALQYKLKYVQMVGSMEIKAILCFVELVVGKGTYMSSSFGDVSFGILLSGGKCLKLGMPLVTYRICG